MLKHMMDAVTEIYPQIPVCVHLDHGNGPDTCMTAIQAGFTSVMMDGSLKADGKTAADWDYNVGVTKTVTDMAHLGGISVEGELGVLGSLETGMGDEERDQHREPRRGAGPGGVVVHRHLAHAATLVLNTPIAPRPLVRSSAMSSTHRPAPHRR